MTVMTLVVVGATILLIWMVVHSYSGRDGSPRPQPAQRAHAGHGGDTVMFAGGHASGSDCSAGDSGGGCGDGGGGGGGGD